MRNRTHLASILFGLVLLAASYSMADETAAIDLVKRLEGERISLAGKLSPAVCAVFRGQGGGSGVIFTPDGLVLSNFHVTGLSSEMRIGLDDHRIHPAVVLGVDPSGDLSLLRLKEDRSWSFAPLGDSDALRQGDWVYAMGNPFLLATDFTPTITLGVVSGINRYQPGSVRGQLLYPDCIQTDASINPGNSGGPLFNFRGEVVGINGRVSLRGRGRVNIGVGYAISSNQIKHSLPELRAGQVVEHGTLNATVRAIDDPEWPGGARVTFDQLMDPGCAFEAGVEVGDVLVAFQGIRDLGVNEFLRHISVLPKGRRVNVTIAKFGDDGWKEQTLPITLDGIQLVKESDKRKKETPRTFIEQEIERTFAASRAALQPIGSESRKGSLLVTGRDPKSLKESYSADGTMRITHGDRLVEVKADGGTDGAKPLDPDRRTDLLERVSAWNDMVAQDGTRIFESVDFTGGALVGGTTVDRMEVKTKAGTQRVYYIHLQTGRLLRLDLYAQSWVRWISLYFDDWRTAGGLQRPYKVAIWDREKEKLLQTITYESIGKDS
jgi:S1-C subfamily serine protease